MSTTPSERAASTPSGTAGSAETVASVVRSVAITGAPTATPREAATLMASNEVGLVVGISDRRLLGVASERDLVVFMRDLAPRLTSD